MPLPTLGGKDTVAVTLAVGLATAINIITLAVLYNAIRNNQGLSENATQVLSTSFGGIVGVLGGFIGYQKGIQHQRQQDDAIAADRANRDDALDNGE